MLLGRQDYHNAPFYYVNDYVVSHFYFVNDSVVSLSAASGVTGMLAGGQALPTA